GGVEHVNPPLKILKAARLALVVERDDLPVEDERLLARARPFLQRLGDLGKLPRLLVAEPRPQAHAAPRRDLGDRTDTVVLGLVDEVRVVERRVVARRREHRLEDVEHRGWGWALGARRWLHSRYLFASAPIVASPRSRAPPPGTKRHSSSACGRRRVSRRRASSPRSVLLLWHPFRSAPGCGGDAP